MAAAMNPDEVVFRSHLAAGHFLLGVASKRWRMASITWPYAEIWVMASDGTEYGFRFECSNYPRTPATAQLWHIGKNVPLPRDRWPKGTSRVPLAFNPNWKDGTAIYLPCDRVSIEGHENWRNEHPSMIWDPVVGIAHYLRLLHELLNSGDYEGRHAA